MNEIKLEEISTNRLVEELKNRKGVQAIVVEPYQAYKISVDKVIKGQHTNYHKLAKSLSKIGPAIILNIED